MKDCRHIVGLLYGHEESSYTGELIDVSELSLSTIEGIKNEGETFDYCSSCGAEIKGLIDTTKERLLKEKAEQEAQVALKRKKDKEAFEEKIQEVLSHSPFDKLNDQDSYCIITRLPEGNPTGKSSALFSGEKNYIARNCVHNQRILKSLKLDVESIERLPSRDALISMLSVKHKIDSKDVSGTPEFMFSHNKKDYSFSYTPENGVIYLAISWVDEDGDKDKSYHQYRPSEFLKSLEVNYEADFIIK